MVQKYELFPKLPNNSAKKKTTNGLFQIYREDRLRNYCFQNKNKIDKIHKTNDIRHKSRL